MQVWKQAFISFNFLVKYKWFPDISSKPIYISHILSIFSHPLTPHHLIGEDYLSVCDTLLIRWHFMGDFSNLSALSRRISRSFFLVSVSHGMYIFLFLFIVFLLIFQTFSYVEHFVLHLFIFISRQHTNTW